MDKLLDRTYGIEFISAMLIMFVASTIMLETLKSTTDMMYNSAELLGLGIGILIYRYMERDSVREWLVNHWQWMLFIVAIVHYMVILVGWYHLEWRYFTIVVMLTNVSSASGLTRMTITNKLLSDNTLTLYHIREERWIRTGRVVGLVSILAYVKMSGEVLPMWVGFTIHGITCGLSILRDSLWYRHYHNKLIGNNLSHT